MPRDGWTAETYFQVRQHVLRERGLVVATVARAICKTTGPWSVWLGHNGWDKIGSASTVSEGKAMAEAQLARRGKEVS